MRSRAMRGYVSPASNQNANATSCDNEKSLTRGRSDESFPG